MNNGIMSLPDRTQGEKGKRVKRVTLRIIYNSMNTFYWFCLAWLHIRIEYSAENRTVSYQVLKDSKGRGFGIHNKTVDQIVKILAQPYIVPLETFSGHT